MTETYFARITEVLPSRIVATIAMNDNSAPLVRTLDSMPMVGVIELKAGNTFKITIETNPGEVITKYSPAEKSEYVEL